MQAMNVALAQLPFFQCGHSLSEAAQVLTESFALSRRQAYRHLADAQALARPLSVAEPTIPATIKVPGEMGQRDQIGQRGPARTDLESSPCSRG